LSADRANAARRLMQQYGVRADQVTQVRGYADQMLRVKADPFDPSNRRISILVKNDAPGAPVIAKGRVVGGAEEAPRAEKPASPKTANAHADGSQPQTGNGRQPAAAQRAPGAPVKLGLLTRIRRMLPGVHR
jgi:chemotaxis protein MotB